MTATDLELPPLTEHQDKIVRMIDTLRGLHHACSVGLLEKALRFSKAEVHRQLQALRDKGYVEWSEGIGGSIRRVGTVEISVDRLAALEAALNDYADGR